MRSWFAWESQAKESIFGFAKLAQSHSSIAVMHSQSDAAIFTESQSTTRVIQLLSFTHLSLGSYHSYSREYKLLIDQQSAQTSHAEPNCIHEDLLCFGSNKWTQKLFHCLELFGGCLSCWTSRTNSKIGCCLRHSAYFVRIKRRNNTDITNHSVLVLIRFFHQVNSVF